MTAEQEWAMIRLNEYVYREKFGLSKQEYDNEPYEDYVINSEILGLISKYEKKEQDKASRKGKRRIL